MEQPAVKRARRKSPGRFHHGDLPEQAAVAATLLIATRGHDGLSMRALASKLGVTEPALYRHYGGRDALLAEVAVRGFQRFGEVMRDELRATTSPLDGVSRFCRAYVRYAAANRGWFRLTFSREISEGPHAAALFAARLGDLQNARQELLVLLGQALPAGDSRAADLYRLIWGTAHGLAFLVVERVFQLVKTDEARIAAADDAIALLVESLSARLGGPARGRP